MKKTIVFLVAALMGQLVFAQAPETKPAAPAEGIENTMPPNKEHHKKHGHEKREMMKALNLTEEQKAKLKEMNAGNKEKKQAILNDSKLTEEQKKEQLKAIKKEQAKSMQTVLTDEQKTKMKEARMKMKESKRNRKDMKMKGRPAGANAPAGSAVPQQQ
jgi:organic radical activating enzyme